MKKTIKSIKLNQPSNRLKINGRILIFLENDMDRNYLSMDQWEVDHFIKYEDNKSNVSYKSKA